MQLFGKPADYLPPLVYSPNENKSSLEICKAKGCGGVKKKKKKRLQLAPNWAL